MLEEFLTFAPAQRRTAVALGVFDGVHIGHRAVLHEAANSGDLEPWVFTFAEESISRAKKGAVRLEPPCVKFNIMKKCGIAHVYAPDFAEVCSLSGEEFVRKVLIEHLKCKKVVCGTDFRFGKYAACDAEDMKRFCKEFGMECALIEKLYDGSEAISSTRIRIAAANGDMKTVRRLCGYPFCIENTVMCGKHLGREYGLPTINQGFEEGYVIPKYGVYVSAAYVEGKFYPAVTNVGVKPTVSSDGVPAAETNLIGFSGDLYGKKAFVFLLDLVRPEMKFENREELFARIAFDRDNAKSIAESWIESCGAETAALLGI